MSNAIIYALTMGVTLIIILGLVNFLENRKKPELEEGDNPQTS